eukprot:Phypoly_transcript_20412.p1 GENE.Phypoly_transcript_20412~~Phypoly_transcript_20412.p1  ORF type:complete len:182 (+),score=15.91 Phypoly_transcript_20412:107-652(+)
MRKLRFHEAKLLKKVDFIDWKDNNLIENKILSLYHIQRREDYHKYVKLTILIKKFCTMLSKLEPSDPVRNQLTDQLLEKLYTIGLIDEKKSLATCANINDQRFCRRRLPVVLVRNKFCENLKAATTFILQGHIRIGPQVVTDPAFIVTRNLEDLITWVDQSKIKQKVQRYNNLLDDYDLFH